jgi:histidinol phosphatase-like enzyme
LKLLILELEGTLVTFGDSVGAWNEMDLIGFTKPNEPKFKDIIVTELAHEKLMYYKDRGFKVVVFTSRPDVAMGEKTVDDIYGLFFTVNGLLDNIIDGFMICPDHPDGVVRKYAVESGCYKSKTGLLPRFYAEMSKIEEEEVSRDSFSEVIVVSHLDEDYQFAVDNGFKFRKPGEFF